MSKEAMKLALEALQECASIVEHCVIGVDAENAVNNANEAIKALEEELAKQEQGGHEDEKKAANGQFTTMVEPSIHAGSGEKIGFPHRGQKQEQGAPVEVDQNTMELAESVGLIGPASRTHDLHVAIQRFHDLICANATIKAALAFAHPQQRKPLTDEQADNIINGLRTCLHRDSKRQFLKTWLRDWAAHGIKG